MFSLNLWIWKTYPISISEIQSEMSYPRIYNVKENLQRRSNTKK